MNKKLQAFGGGFAMLPFWASNALAASTYKPVFQPFQTWPEFWGHFIVALLLCGLVWWNVKIGRPAQVLVMLLICHLIVTAHVPGAWYWAVQLLQLVAGVVAFFFIQ